ncbi:MAG: TlpA family protein disulfide reductase [Phycisphaerae bacterium]
MTTTKRMVGVCLGFLLWVGAAAAGPYSTDKAFPPGTFSDGNTYSFEDFAGQVLVLYFYESGCPSCRDMVPVLNEMHARWAAKGVYFIAVGAEDASSKANMYARTTGMQFPVFADHVGLLSESFGHQISLRNIRKFDIILPDGQRKRVGLHLTDADLAAAVEQIPDPIDMETLPPSLAPAVMAMRLNRYEPALKLLDRAARSRNEAQAQAATQLTEAIHAKAKAAVAEADAAAEEGRLAEAFVAYEGVQRRYGRIDGITDHVPGRLSTLRRESDVQFELEARKQYERFARGVLQASPQNRAELMAFAQQYLSKYGQTPTGRTVANMTGLSTTAP